MNDSFFCGATPTEPLLSDSKNGASLARLAVMIYDLSDVNFSGDRSSMLLLIWEQGVEGT